jgi:hypothetical protein
VGRSGRLISSAEHKACYQSTTEACSSRQLIQPAEGGMEAEETLILEEIGETYLDEGFC